MSDHAAGKPALSPKLVLRATLHYPIHYSLSTSAVIAVLKCGPVVLPSNEGGIVSVFISKL